jgi:hypothetical protein
MLKAEMNDVIAQQQAQIDELTEQLQLREMVELLREQNAILRSQPDAVRQAPTPVVAKPAAPKAPAKTKPAPKVASPKAPNGGGGRKRRSDITDPTTVAQLLRHGADVTRATPKVLAAAKAINRARRAAKAAEAASDKPQPKATTPVVNGQLDALTQQVAVLTAAVSKLVS